MKLSQKLNIFSEFFSAFLKFVFNSENFAKKDESHSLCLSEVTDCEIRAYVNV